MSLSAWFVNLRRSRPTSRDTISIARFASPNGRDAKRPMLRDGSCSVPLVGTHVRSKVLALMEDLDGGGHGAEFHGLPCQRIGRAVEAHVELV